MLVLGQRSALIDDQTQNFAHQTKYSDGEIYRHMRLHQRANRARSELQAREWKLQLTPCKQKIVDLLLKRPAIVEALDTLLPFVGVWAGLQIGNIHKHLALHCDEQVVNVLRHTRDSCLNMTAGVSPEALDGDTMRHLQRLAPSVTADRQYIQHLFQQNRVFSSITDPLVRERLLKQVLSLDTMISSLETFHENMKYFAIGARILRRYLLGGQGGERGQDQEGDQGRDQEEDQKGDSADKTVLQRLEWQCPVAPCVEIGEGIFQPSTEMEKETAFSMLFLFALRHFPFLDTITPLQDVKGEGMVAGPMEPYLRHLYSRAKTLGFRSTRIDHELGVAPYVAPLATDHVQPTPGWNRWRGGKPSIRTFFALRSVAFLPTLDATDVEREVTPAFTLKHFMRAYFGCSSYMIDTAGSPTEPPVAPSVSSDRISVAPLGPGFDPDRYGDVGSHLQPPGSAAAPRRARKTRSRVQKRGEDVGRRTKLQSSLPPDFARDFTIQVPSRAAQRSPISIPDLEEVTEPTIATNRRKLFDHAPPDVFQRPDVAVPEWDVPELVQSLDADVLQPPTSRASKQPKDPSKMRRKGARGLIASWKGSLGKQRDRADRAQKEPEPHPSGFAFRSRRKPVGPPSVARPKDSLIFQWEEGPSRTRHLKRTQAESQEGDPWVDVRAARGSRQEKRRRLQGPEVRAGTKRTASQTREAWTSSIRPTASPRRDTKKKPRRWPSPRGSITLVRDGAASVVEQEPPQPRIERGRSPVEDPEAIHRADLPETPIHTETEVRCNPSRTEHGS